VEAQGQRSRDKSSIQSLTSALLATVGSEKVEYLNFTAIMASTPHLLLKTKKSVKPWLLLRPLAYKATPVSLYYLAFCPFAFLHSLILSRRDLVKGR
jgi:hypothetical protein